MLVGAAPLGIGEASLSARLRFVKVKRLQLLADEHVGFCGFLIAPGHEDVAELLLNAIADRADLWDVGILEPMAQSTTLDDVLEAASYAGLPDIVETRFQSSVIDLSGGWDRYLAQRPRQFRKSVRSTQEKMKAKNLRIMRETDNGSALLERILALSARSWKGRAGTAVGVHASANNLVRNYWAVFGPRREMSLYLLEIDGEDAASVILLRQGSTSYGYVTDFDERYRALSPGRFMVTHAIQDCCKDGITRFDMLRRTHFLESFTDDSYAIKRVRLFPSRNYAYVTIRLEAKMRPLAGGIWNALRGGRALRRDNMKTPQ
jgi:CelD/BcsL family acetyltransferase involved in cellulose biosynthesis